MIVRSKEIPDKAYLIDVDAEGFYYFRIEPSPDMPFPPSDFEIISP